MCTEPMPSPSPSPHGLIEGREVNTRFEVNNKSIGPREVDEKKMLWTKLWAEERAKVSGRMGHPGVGRSVLLSAVGSDRVPKSDVMSATRYRYESCYELWYELRDE